MMRKNVYLIVWLMTVILYSCYDDKGNYSYEDIDEISIAGMPDTLVTVFKNTDTLKVVPELKHTLAAGSGKYEYTWVAVAKENKTGNEFEYEIGKEKNLNYFIIGKIRCLFECVGPRDRSDLAATFRHGGDYSDN